MLITLVTPPSGFLLDQRVFASLGILKVGAALRIAGHSVEHLDLSGVKNYEDVIRVHLKSSPSKVFALTATTPQMPAAMKINSIIRQEAPDVKTILGGPHATLVNAAGKGEQRRSVEGRGTHGLSLLLQSFDVVVAGDGERAILQALLFDSRLVDADDPKSPFWLTSQGFTESPWPARDLLDIESYHYYVDGERALSLISQLGCPYRCSFCAGRDSSMLRRIRLRPPGDAKAEMVHLYETYGVKGYFFLDDELNVNKQMLGLMQGLKEEAESRGIEWRLRGFLKAELFTEEQAEAMYAAGFRQLLIGFESGHDRILTNIQKVATKEDNTRAMRIAKEHGLKVKALMSLGHPGETEETALAIRDWLLDVKPADMDCTIITPYPGSPYYDEAVLQPDGSYCYAAPKTGDKLYMENVDFNKEVQFYKGAPGAYQSFVWTNELSPKRLCELRDQIEYDVRTALGIPFYTAGAAQSIEHSMGMTGIPGNILRGGVN